MKDYGSGTSVRGGKEHIHTGNADGTGGRSKGQNSAETLVRDGVQYKTRISEKPEELGMCTVGPSEKPQGTAKHEVSARGRNFKFR